MDRYRSRGWAPALALSIVLALATRSLSAQDPCTGFWRTFPLGAGYVTALTAAPDGRLFVGVRNGGLRIFGPNSSGLYVWSTVVSGRGSGLASNAVTTLAIEDDELWIGTDDAGASVLSLTDGSWRTYNTSNSGLPSNRIYRITPAPLQLYRQVWLSTSDGAARYRANRLSGAESWRVLGTAQGIFVSDRIRDVAIQGEGLTATTWIATSKELFTWNGTSSQVDHVSATYACSFDTASRLAVDGSNRVWFGSLRDEPDGLVPRGLCSYASRGRVTWEHFPDLAPRYVWDMSTDPAGRLWLAVDGGGAVHDQGTWCFYSKPEFPLYSNSLGAVAAAGEGVWFGHRDALALTFHSPNWDRLYLGSAAEASGTPRALLLEDSTLWIGVGTGIAQATGGFIAIPGNGSPVTALARDGAGKLWIGTAGNGLYAFDGVSFKHHLGGGLPSADVRALAVDGAGRVWAATAGGLALRGAGYWLALTSANSPLASDDLRALALDGAGRLWIGTGSAGIHVLESTGDGAGTWSKEDASTGLPANAVRGLAVEASGAVWAATSAGAARRDPATGLWTTYDAPSGALPSSSALCVASDPGGRVWVGTARGLARKEGHSWQHFHATSSTLESDRVLAVAATSDQVWAAAGKWVAVRSDVTGPIGHYPPEIDSFSPAQGPPGASVTIEGSGFDDRGPSFNRVTFGPHAAGGGYSPAAEVLSVTSSQLVVKVPALATSGKIKVVAHHLSAESAGQFKVVPAITALNPSCLGVGGELVIEGGGFLGDGGGQWPKLKLGDGELRSLDPGFDSVTATHIRYRVRQGDTSGPVRVRLPSGLQVVSSGEVSIGSLQVKRVRIQHGVDYKRPLIWGKRTLVHLDFEAEDCEIQISGGTLFWKKKDGTLLRGSWAYQVAPGSQPVHVSFDAPAMVDDVRGLDFVAEFSSNRSGWSKQFPLSEFDGVRIVVVNRGIEVLAVDVPASQFNYEDPGTPLKVRCMAVLPEEGLPRTPKKEFWRRAVEGMEHMARMYPQADIGALHGPRVWLGHTSTYIRRSGPIDLDDDDQYCDVKGAVDDYLDPDDDTIGIALVDDMLLAGGDPLGKAPFDSLGCAGVVFNIDKKTGEVMAHEGGHMVGLVDEDAANHDSGNEHHSRYDEGDFSSCVGSDTFRASLLDQGAAPWRVYRLDQDAPFRFSKKSCGKNRPKSVMPSEAIGDNYNTFLEVLDYAHIRGVVGSLGGGGGGGAGGAALAEAAGSGGGGTAFFLRLKGVLEIAGGARVTLSYLEEPSGAPSRPDPAGDYRLELRGAAGELLLGHPFHVSFMTGDGPVPQARFGLRVPFDDAAARALLLRGDEVLWSRAVSASPPAVSFVSPSGGKFAAAAEVEVRWAASDPDGDALQFALDYSPDGETWHPLPQYLTGDSYLWRPGFLPPSPAARLRLRASDGFHTHTALSAPFALEPAAPLAFITAPRGGATFTEGQRIDLAGASLAASGPDQGTFRWSVNGVPSGKGKTLDHTPQGVGPQTIRLEVTADGRTDADEVTVTVIADLDHDGMPNAWEEEHGLNPLAPADAFADPDLDRLQNLAELLHGTDLRTADSDGDGFGDGDEVEAGTDPLDPADRPLVGPVLRVGAETLGFTWHQGAPLPAPKSTWVNNSGTGDLVFSAESTVPWLEVSPPAGEAPAELSISVFPTALQPGEYTGQVVVSAPGAAESPRAIEVTLRVLPPLPGTVGQRFLRADANADRKVDISDAVFTLAYLFLGGPDPACEKAADANDSGKVDLSDAVYTLIFLFAQGSSPPPPHPACGEDPTPDGLSCVELTCP